MSTGYMRWGQWAAVSTDSMPHQPVSQSDFDPGQYGVVGTEHSLRQTECSGQEEAGTPGAGGHSQDGNMTLRPTPQAG